MTNFLNTNIEIIHRVVGVGSSLICFFLGLKLCLVHFCKYINIKSPFRHSRYIAARRALGIAYILIGAFSLILLFTVDVCDKATKDFFPLIGLIISISQIILFTVAVLAFFNSRLLNRTIVTANVAPIALLLLLYALFDGYEQIQFSLRFALFIYYLLQLVVYTFAYIMERRKYLLIIEDYFDQGQLYEKYNCKGIAILYYCAIGIGFWALVSYFFTILLQETTFIFCYTIFYCVVAWYYFHSSKISRRIQDVTTPENWSRTEQYSQSMNAEDKKEIQNIGNRSSGIL